MDNTLNFDKNKVLKIVTHSDGFHTDDVFSTALIVKILKQNNYNYEIIRTRDEEVISQADIVYDVGGIYDPLENKFDHHQNDTSLIRDGIPYSSFGLVWKQFGCIVCNDNKTLWDKIDNNLVKPIDCIDNGIAISQDLFEFRPLNISVLTSYFNPTWKELEDNSQCNELFYNAVDFASHIIDRYLECYRQSLSDSVIVQNIYENTKDKRIILIDGMYEYYDALSPFNEILIVIKGKDNKWSIKMQPVQNKIFESKIYCPKEWRGLEGKELEKVTGVMGSIFCHKNGFLCTTNSKDSALLIANKILENSTE